MQGPASRTPGALAIRTLKEGPQTPHAVMNPELNPPGMLRGLTIGVVWPSIRLIGHAGKY